MDEAHGAVALTAAQQRIFTALLIAPAYLALDLRRVSNATLDFDFFLLCKLLIVSQLQLAAALDRGPVSTIELS